MLLLVPKQCAQETFFYGLLEANDRFKGEVSTKATPKISSRVTWLGLNLDLGISLEPLDRLAEAGSSTPSPVVSRGSAWKWGRLLSANDTAKVILRKVS